MSFNKLPCKELPCKRLSGNKLHCKELLPSNELPSNELPNNKSSCHSRGIPCFQEGIFNIDKEPVEKKGYTYLNPSMPDDFSQDFKKIDGVYVSSDPRLFDSPRAQLLELDRPPLNGSVPMYDVYLNKSLDGYGQCYTSYCDIRAGDIRYYVDKSIEDAFFSPNFVNKSTVISTNYVDPMTTNKPHYYRINCYSPIAAGVGINLNPAKLSWISDSNEHREDIMSKQMAQNNQKRFEPYYKQ